MSFRGGRNKGSSISRRTEEHQKFVRLQGASRAQDRPNNFDVRLARPGMITPVKDQAMCGSCWAYGAIQPIETAHALATGKLTVLPEQYIVDCTWTNNTGASHGNFGCDGGDSDIGVLEVVRKFGGIVPTAQAYGSYLSVNGYCKDIKLMDVGAKVTGWVDIKSRDEDALLEAIYHKGVVNVNIMVPDEMLFYETGVLKVPSCQHNSSQIDHAVVAVGYGTDKHGVDYYTIKNSWSTYWGNQGYINIARGEMDCSVSDEAGYPEVEGPSSSIVV